MNNRGHQKVMRNFSLIIEVNEITVNPPEFSFFHNDITSCKGEEVSRSLSPREKLPGKV